MMKKKVILLGSAIAVAIVAIADNRTLLVYHDGSIDPFFFSEVEEMSLGYDKAGQFSQFIHTPDSVYSFAIEAIDSIAFQPIPTKIKPEVTLLSGDLKDYILGSADTGEGCELYLSTATPANILPKRNDLLLQFEPTDKLPYGFAGKVSWIVTENDHTVLQCYSAEPFKFFDQLSYVAGADISTGDETTAKIRKSAANEEKVSVTLPTLAEKLSYPELIEGVITMTDEMRDIPAGPAKGVLEGKISMTPKVSCMMGVYVLPFPDGEIKQKRRMRTSVRASVEAVMDGRYVIDDRQVHTVGKNSSLKMVIPFAFGQNVTLSFSGTMTVAGEGGIDHTYNGAFSSEAITDVCYDEYGDMLAKTQVTHSVTKPVLRELSALMNKSASISGTLSIVATQGGDTLKAISNSYTYGSSLKGNAIYKTSKLTGMDKSTDLYQQLTSTGIKATSTENITTSVKYADQTFTMKPKTEATPAVTFYAVPKFTGVIYNPGARTFSYAITGTPMKFANSKLGISWRKTDDTYTYYPTEQNWPFTTLNKFDDVSAPDGYDTKGFIYPTVTLPDGTMILATPQYPVHNGMAPIFFTAAKSGIHITGGAVILGEATANGIHIHAGNLFPTKSKDKK